mgnify:CR=1 FL=1|tara:strand:+ start:610 stop:1395 length:786 start_codon:yes stop_codon:yes gene_type:complete
MSDIKKTMEAYLSMVSETAEIDEARQMKDPKKDSMVQKGGKTIVIDKSKEKEYLKKGWQLAEKNLDPVDDKANDKKFKNRKDKDIDNDGDVDSSDEFLHKRRKAIDNEKDGGEKPAKNEKVKAKEGETEAEKDEKEADSVEADGETEDKPKADPKKKKKKLPNKDDGDDTPEISKIGEASAEFIKDLESLLEKLKAGTEPEGLLDKESPKSKEFIAKHKVDKKDHEDMEKVLPPKEPKLKKEMAEFEVIRAILSGKPLDGE